jgi:ammonia channel protein AmtB
MFFAEWSIADQVIIQATAVGMTIVNWSAVVAFIAYKLVDMFIGLRVPEDTRNKKAGAARKAGLSGKAIEGQRNTTVLLPCTSTRSSRW